MQILDPKQNRVFIKLISEDGNQQTRIALYEALTITTSNIELNIESLYYLLFRNVVNYYGFTINFITAIIIEGNTNQHQKVCIIKKKNMINPCLLVVLTDKKLRNYINI